MNTANLVGRIASDITMRQTQSGISTCSFRLAVQRQFKNSDGKYESDFISITAWRQTADFIHNFFSKGSMIGIVGSIQTRSYDAQDGSKRYVTEVIADRAEFVGTKHDANAADTPAAAAQSDSGFTEIDDDQLPF